MTSLAKRKRQLLSIVLCFCLIMTGIMVERKEVKAETYYCSEDVKKSDDVYRPYYYGYTCGGTITKSIFSKEADDQLYFGAAYKWEKEGVGPTNPENSQTFSFPEGNWIISDYANVSGSRHVSIVSETAEPQVYLATNATGAGAFVKADVGAADAEGMASVTLPTSQTDPVVKEFYEGLNIKVRKTVKKLSEESFEISITDKATGEDYSSYFNYFGDADGTINWQNEGCLNYPGNNASKALGGILSDDVKIYVKPKQALLRVKAYVENGEGGTITPGNINNCN